MIENYLCSLLYSHYHRNKGESEVDYAFGVILEIGMR